MLSCYHYSAAEPKGSECDEKVADYFTCFSKHSKAYGIEEDNSQSFDNLVDSQSQDLIDSQSKAASDNQSENSESALSKKSTEMKS